MSKKLLGNREKGCVFVISAPSGTGKTTLVQTLCEEFDVIARSITCTTRKPRSNETEDVDYHFITAEVFQKRKEAGDFLESATVFEDQYGTLKQDVEKLQHEGKHVVLVIDTQGASQVREKIEATFIFIAPPSLEELKRRLETRNTDTRHSIEERLSWARKEIEKGREYDYFIINEDLAVVYPVLRSIFIAVEHHL